MKKLSTLFIVLIVLLFVSTAFGFYGGDNSTAKEPEKDDSGKCPITKVKGKVADCKSCHTLITNKEGKIKWGLKEILPFSQFEPPTHSMLKVINGETIGWYDFSGVDASQIRPALEYFFRHGIKKMTFNINSYGGSAFDGYAIVNLFEQYKGKIEITTSVQSYAMSAGFLVWAAGHKRIASPMAVLMWHEISYIAFLRKVTPASSEEDARIMRAWQNTANSYLANRSKMSKEEIDAKIAYKDWFFNGSDALELGFADELIE